jgi:hypothetical protein
MPGMSSFPFFTLSKHLRSYQACFQEWLFTVWYTSASSGHREMCVSICYSIKSEEMDDQMDTKYQNMSKNLCHNTVYNRIGQH